MHSNSVHCYSFDSPRSEPRVCSFISSRDNDHRLQVSQPAYLSRSLWLFTTRVKGNGRFSASSSLMPPLRIMTQFGHFESQAGFNNFPSKLRSTSKGPSHQQRAYHQQSAYHQQRAVPPAKGRAASKGPYRQQRAVRPAKRLPTSNGPFRQQRAIRPAKRLPTSKRTYHQQNDFPVPTSKRVPETPLGTIVGHRR